MSLKLNINVDEMRMTWFKLMRYSLELIALSSLMLVTTGVSAQSNSGQGLFLNGILPEFDGKIHMGVTSCSTGVCHGRSSPSQEDNVLMNEYRTWLRDDLHSKAYSSLLSLEARIMVENLSLPAPAHRSKICLDCHADNVPENLRGERFRISDGVGCEACHGGSENWLDSHRENATHAQNIANGMFPTENLFAQATLCLSCHNGTRDKLAMHSIMGAGHPRLGFELEAYRALQPAHYVVDSDYIERKNVDNSFRSWVVGQMEMAMESLELLNVYVVDGDSIQVELVFYDCQACHHPLEDKRWIPELHSNLPPGTIRLNDSSYLMIKNLLEVVSDDRVPQMTRLIGDLHLASTVSKSALRTSANALHDYIQSIALELSSRDYSDNELVRIRANLLYHAAQGHYRDYAVAEQALLAIDGITIRLGQAQLYRPLMDGLFQALEVEDYSARGFVLFDPDRFIQVAKQVENLIE